MAFSYPTIHHVTKITAKIHSDPSWTHSCLELSFTQKGRLSDDEKYPAKCDIFGDASMVGQFQQIAEAINAAFAEPEAETEAA